jgi:hypothetical protein
MFAPLSVRHITAPPRMVVPVAPGFTQGGGRKSACGGLSVCAFCFARRCQGLNLKDAVTGVVSLCAVELGCAVVTGGQGGDIQWFVAGCGERTQLAPTLSHTLTCSRHDNLFFLFAICVGGVVSHRGPPALCVRSLMPTTAWCLGWPLSPTPMEVSSLLVRGHPRTVCPSCPHSIR